MVDIANFLAQRSPRFDNMEIDRERYDNALLRNEVQRLPQQNRIQDQQIQAQDQGLSQNRSENARRVAAGIFSAIADAPDPISMGARLTQSEMFRSVGAELKLPVDQFKPGPGDDPEQIRAAARSWAQAVGAQAQKPEGYSLSPGQSRYNAANQRVATAPNVPKPPGGADAPSNVQEYQYYQSLPTDEARAEYLRVKRGDQ